MPRPFHWIVSEVVGNFLPFPQQLRKAPQLRRRLWGTEWQGKGAGNPELIQGQGWVTPNSSRGRGLSPGACYTTHPSCSLLCSAPKISGEGGNREQGRGHDRERLWGEAWEHKTHRPRVVFRAARSGSSGTTPQPLHTPGWGPGSPQLTLLPSFVFRVPGGGRRMGRQ